VVLMSNLGGKLRDVPKVLNKIRRIFRGLSIIVIRWNGTKYLNSKPCAICCEMMQQLGIKLVMHSDEKGQIVKIRRNKLESNHYSYGYKVLHPNGT
jgi:hypothetical protein